MTSDTRIFLADSDLPDGTDPADGAARPLRILTQNIRTLAPGTSPGDADHWADRAPVLADLLRTVDADVVGTQEVTFAQIPVLDEVLGATHVRLGVGREGGARGEHNLLWLRRDRFEVLDWDQLWLAEDPRSIGAVGWDGHCPRIAVWARVRDLADAGRELVLADTHLDHAGETAREKGAGLLAQRLREECRGAPVILCGDFNAAGGDSIPWRVLRDAGYSDAHDAADRVDGPDIGTFPDYGESVEGGERIDWILVRGARVLTYAARDHRVGSVHASDHAHVLAEIVVG